nr:outer membrane beta-barrel family protein [uncultured Pedobacter sp.]
MMKIFLILCLIATSSMAQTTDLKEVKITTRKKAIERKIDRTIVNVDGLINVAGTNAFELLSRLPGLRVTEEGAINLMGKGVTVYIDGKLTYLSGADLVSYLKTMGTDQLDKVELIPNPPARYDAAGSGGVINILTKKSKQQGFNTGITLNGGKGIYRKINGSFNFNYRINKLNLFTNVGAGSPKDFQNSSATRSFKNETGSLTSILEQQGEILYNRHNSNVKVGVDYYLNKRTTIGFIFNGLRNRVNEHGGIENLMMNGNHELDSIVNSSHSVNNLFKNGTMNLNMLHQFDSTGTELSIDVDYTHYNSANNQLFGNNSYSASGQALGLERIRGDLPRTIDIFSARADYSFSLKNNYKLSAGLKSSFIKTDNQANYFSGVAELEQPDYNRTNAFLYRENINAFYIEGYRELGELGIKVGLRMEHTSSRGHQLGNIQKSDSSFVRNYFNAFPSFFLSYKPDSTNQNQFFLSYGKRINRPAYDQLNPFLMVVQKYNQESGNPFLSPEFTNNVQLTHVFKDKLTTNVYYSFMSNTSSPVIKAINDVYIKKPENVGSVILTGLMLSYNQDIFKWWNADFTVNPERVHLQSEFNGITVDTAVVMQSFNWYNRFSLSKTWSADLAFDWGGRNYSNQVTSFGIAGIRAGVKKQLFSGNGSIGINGSDLFYSAIRKGSIHNVVGSSAAFRNRQDTRTVILSFSYRISKNAKNNKRLRDRNGAWDEQNRIKGL